MTDKAQCAAIARQAMVQLTSANRPLHNSSLFYIDYRDIGQSELASTIVYEDAYKPCMAGKGVSFDVTVKALACAESASDAQQNLTGRSQALSGSINISRSGSVQSQELAVGALAGKLAYENYTECMGTSKSFIVKPAPKEQSRTR